MYPHSSFEFEQGYEPKIQILKDGFIIQSDFKSVKIIRDYISSLLSEQRISREIIKNVVAALDEAMMNAIIHGNKFERDKLVMIGYSIEPDSITLIVSDEGDGFNPESIPDPTLPENISEPGGRGIHVIKSLMDSVSWRNGGRVIEMKKYFR